MLGDAPGVGKTGQAIIASDPSWKILVVCPASVKNQWRQAVWDWADWKSFIVEGKDIPKNPSIVIVNYDRIIREPILRSLLKHKWDLIIYDESHKIKNPKAKRTKVALGKRYLFPRAKRIWFLTGTPVKNRTVDLWPILKTCAPEVLGKYNTYLKFCYRYCGAYTGRFGLDVSGASHTEELYERMKPFMLRREKRDVLTELPPRIISKVELDCTPAVKKLIFEEEQKTIEAAGEDDPALFKLGETARIRQVLAKYKVPASVAYINDLLEETNKVVVFYHHKSVLDELKRAFPKIPHVYIDGSVPPEKRPVIVDRFARRPEVRLFFGQMQACGEGIDGLQSACSDCVFVEPSWSHTDIEQCIGRLERSGQRNDVNVHILTIKNTLEARMMDVVAMKLNVDKKLYNQKGEEQMATRKKTTATKETEKDPMRMIGEAMLEIAAAMTKTVEVLVKSYEENNGGEPAANPSDGTSAEPVEAEPQEEDVTEDAIRARAGDIAALAPDGSGKAKVVEIIKKIGGGKIADLKTPALRRKAMAALDALYNDLDV